MKEEFLEDDFHWIGPKRVKYQFVNRKPLTYWQDALQRFKRNKLAMTALLLLLLIIILCVFVPILSPYEYDKQNLLERKQWPSSSHWFGTDELGRDLFTRVWYGGRVSITIGIVGASISAIVGTIYGGIAAYYGGLVDDIMMRIVEILSSIPSLLIMISMSLYFDNTNIFTILLALTITGWCPIARTVRSQMLQIREEDYVVAAKVLGVSSWGIIINHFIPNTLSLIIVNLTFRIPGYIFSEAFLSYVGLGIQPPETSWGAIASSGQFNLIFAPYIMFFPSMMIALCMLCFTVIGDGLRDALDPKLRR